MRRLVCAAISLTAIAAVAVPAASIIFTQRRELRLAHDARQTFCHGEWSLVRTHVHGIELTGNPKERERLAMRILDRYEFTSILELCAPDVKLDASVEVGCWLSKGDPDCIKPFMQRVQSALVRWRGF